MCVIIEKLAGKEVPYEHLLAGAHRNSDGFGVVVCDGDKKLIVDQGLGEPVEAADRVADILSRHKECMAYAHFRYRTVGKVSVENTHPITILTRESDGVDLQFMHNGTLSGWRGTEDQSDSSVFAQNMLIPLAKRSAAYLGPDEVTSDPILAKVLNEFSDNLSKFVLFDSNGNSMVINRRAGAEQEYGWASNTYSLLSSNIPKAKSKTTVLYPSAWLSKDDEYKTEHQELVETINRQKGGKTLSETCHPSVRVTVKDITGFEPKAFQCLDIEQIRTLVDEEPDLAALLIADLLHENYNTEFAKAA